MVLRDDTDEGGPALGNPPVLGGDVSRGGCNRGVTHSGQSSPGLAPERDRLRQGLRLRSTILISSVSPEVDLSAPS